MLEGLWVVEFRSSQEAFGAGVVIFKGNKIFGGDSIYYYLGTFETKDNKTLAEIEIKHHSGEPLSVFGPRLSFKIRLAGNIQEPVMEFKGYLEDAPTSEITIRCTKIADLS